MTNLDPHLTRYRELTFGYDTKARATKAQILTRATPNGSFFTAKETINKMKRQTAEWEKMFINHSSDKEVISKIKKELIQLNSKKNANMQLKNGQNTDFIKKDTQRNSLVVHSALALQGAWVQSPVRELISCMPHGTANKKKDTQVINIYMKRDSTPQTIRGMQIKTTMSHHFTSIRMTTTKTQDDKHQQET